MEKYLLNLEKYIKIESEIERLELLRVQALSGEEKREIDRKKRYKEEERRLLRKEVFPEGRSKIVDWKRRREEYKRERERKEEKRKRRRTSERKRKMNKKKEKKGD